MYVLRIPFMYKLLCLVQTCKFTAHRPVTHVLLYHIRIIKAAGISAVLPCLMIHQETARLAH